MTLQASIEQVAGILVREGLHFQTHEDGTSYRLLYGDHAVFVFFDPWGDDDVVITVTSHALQHIDEDEPGGAVASAAVAALTDRHAFVKWRFADGALTATSELLGGDLHRRQLRNAIQAVVGAVELAVAELQEDTGGLVWADAERLRLEEAEVE